MPTPTPTPTPIWNNGPIFGGGSCSSGATCTPSPTPGWSGGGDFPGGSSGGGSRGFGDDWITPTMFPTTDATAPVIINVPMKMLPDNIVQGYNFVNQQHGFDTVWIVTLVILIIGGFTSLYKRMKEL